MRVSARASAAPPAGRPRSQAPCPCKPFTRQGGDKRGSEGGFSFLTSLSSLRKSPKGDFLPPAIPKDIFAPSVV